MAEDYKIRLKAELDTREVTQKLRQLGSTGGQNINGLEQAVKGLDQAIQRLGASFEKANQQAKELNSTAAQTSRNTSQSFGSFGKQIRMAYAGSIMQRMGGQLAGDYSNLGRMALGVPLNIAGGAVTGASVGGPYGAVAGAVLTGVNELVKGITAIKEASIKENLKFQEEMDEPQKNEGRSKENAGRLQSDAASKISRERERQRELQGLESLGDEELKERRQKAYDTRRHYEDNLVNGVYEYEGAVKDAMDQIQMAKDIANAANAILKARKGEAEASERAKEAEEKRLQDLENDINEQAYERLRQMQYEDTMEQWERQVENMTPGDLLKNQRDLKALYAIQRGQVRDYIEKGDLDAADSMSEQMKETKDKLDSIESVLGGIQSGTGLRLLDSVSTLQSMGYSTLGNQSLGSAVENFQQQHQREMLEQQKNTNQILEQMRVSVSEIRNKVDSSSGMQATW